MIPQLRHFHEFSFGTTTWVVLWISPLILLQFFTLKQIQVVWILKSDNLNLKKKLTYTKSHSPLFKTNRAENQAKYRKWITISFQLIFRYTHGLFQWETCDPLNMLVYLPMTSFWRLFPWWYRMDQRTPAHETLLNLWQRRSQEGH